ncbi:uncharacterized protein TrAtP1_012998 [Trichoderma atroviride]|uniref:uncharacterized protein n=1 Tax=Hypocrea atroviridis TaxID=63577 RepID=UPI0033211AFE|nr:hypothetical protein TrAtP1_012998 [Trichoderma atroviride]
MSFRAQIRAQNRGLSWIGSQVRLSVTSSSIPFCAFPSPSSRSSTSLSLPLSPSPPRLRFAVVGAQDRHRSQPAPQRLHRYNDCYRHCPQRRYQRQRAVDPRLSKPLISAVSAIRIAQAQAQSQAATPSSSRSNKLRSPLLPRANPVFSNPATPHRRLSRRHFSSSPTTTTMPVGTVLVTGGTGYIGSFTTLALLDAGYDVVIVDSLYNSSKVALDRIELLAGRRPDFYQIDITDEKALDEVFAKHPSIDSVIHFAALKAVGESSVIPLEYYRVNVGGSIALLQSMSRNNVTNIVFSSSATVYGDATRFPNMIPIPEHCPIGPTNTYGRTKSMIEDVISDYINAQRNNLEKEGKPFQQWNGALLRYFNPWCGAQPQRYHGRGSSGCSFQPAPPAGTGCHRPAREAPCLRRGLPFSRRNRHPRLHSRCRSCSRPLGRSQLPPRQPARCQGLELGFWSWQHCLRDRQGIQRRRWSRFEIRGRCPQSRRCPRLDCQPHSGQHRAELED